MRQVTAVRKIHSEHRVARLHHGRVGFFVGLRSGVRLHVDVLGLEQFFTRSRARFSTMSANSQPP